MNSDNSQFNYNISLRVKILIFLCLVGIITLLFPRGESLEFRLDAGSIWLQDDLIADRSFPILKDATTYSEEIKLARKSVFPIFQKLPVNHESVNDSVKKYSEIIFSEKKIPNYIVFLSNSSKNAITKSESKKKLAAQFHDLVNKELQYFRNKDIINISFNELNNDTLAVRDRKFDLLKNKTLFWDKNKIRDKLLSDISTIFPNNPELTIAAVEYVYYFIPTNYAYDKSLTEKEIKERELKVSRNQGIVDENEKIVSKHEKITPEIKRKIESYRISKSKESTISGTAKQILGKFVHVAAILTLFVIYIFLFRKKLYNNNLHLIMISLIIIFVSVLAYLISSIDVQYPIRFLIIVPVASMLFTILFDSRLGFYGTVVTALLVGGIRGNDYPFTIISVFAGALAVYTVRDIKNRRQIFRSFVYIMLGYLLSILAFGLERYDDINNIMLEVSIASINALFSPILTYGLTIFFEKFFGITTDLTYLELTDFNCDLLKTLQANSPGTFMHSLALGSMVEIGAEAVGANPLLARVGAYYHDIGKTMNPEYFIENQTGSNNIHETLTPEASRDIIIDHVKKGVQIAKFNKLPESVIDFIPMHHGTMVVKFFYEKAKELYGENVNIDDYRYLGPKPNTKETAILMLADACESTVRSMKNADRTRIENVVSNIFKQRLDDGQLNESTLTFKDLIIIKEKFILFLLSQFHTRIKYPMQDQMENTKV